MIAHRFSFRFHWRRGVDIIVAGRTAGDRSRVGADGAYSDAVWTAYNYPESALTTGNTVYQDTLMCVFAVSGVKGVQSYAATFTAGDQRASHGA